MACVIWVLRKSSTATTPQRRRNSCAAWPWGPGPVAMLRDKDVLNPAKTTHMEDSNDR
jgi:hypothetical protein